MAYYFGRPGLCGSRLQWWQLWPWLDADADRVDLESRLIKLLLEDRALIRLPATAPHGAKRTFILNSIS
jgi:hypothetical protein